jgi:hypothetical protein
VVFRPTPSSASTAVAGFDDGIEVWLTGANVDNYVTLTLEDRRTGADSALQTYRHQDARAGGGRSAGGGAS